jgi:hypothetical protein
VLANSKILSYILSYNSAARDGTARHEALTGQDLTVGSPLAGRLFGNFTIFEGTSEIQRLVIARAISGIHIQ